MVDLLSRQQNLWQIITAGSDLHPMLRLSRTDDCLWICDLPRRGVTSLCQAVRIQLEQSGFTVQIDQQKNLWQIDLANTDELFTKREESLLPFPKTETLHSCYSLYRLLAAHPSPITMQPKALLRAILKLTAKSPTENPAIFNEVYCQCAGLLNRKEVLPSAACYALYQYIRQEDER